MDIILKTIDTARNKINFLNSLLAEATKQGDLERISSLEAEIAGYEEVISKLEA